MKIRASGRFNFHNVGQGLFYTGNIKHENFEFNFIYDCGVSRNSTSYLNPAISNYKLKILRNNKINLLILSHLHEDHVSGVDRFLGNNKKNCVVETVVLPYFTPLERLLISLKETSSHSGYFRRYFDFLRDPVEYLFKKGVRKIYLVIGDKELKKGENVEARNFPNNESIINELLAKDPNWHDRLQSQELSILSHHSFIRPINYWQFNFFVLPVQQICLEMFYKCLERSRIVPLNQNQIKAAIIDHNQRRTLRNCYKNLNHNINQTSMILSIFP